MSAIEDFDGLCGIISRFASSTQQVRCKYKFGHNGLCSFKVNEEVSGPIKTFFFHPVSEYTQSKK